MSLGLTSDQEWEDGASRRVSLLLQKVKAKLMSREFEQQSEAVSWLCHELSVNAMVGLDSFVGILLNSEIIVLLCEMTMTMQGAIVTSTLKCFASLTQFEQFYKHNHASHVVASILQTGHFLTLQELGKRNIDEIVRVKSIVRTLEKIFEGATGFRVSINKICDLQQVFKILNKLLSGEYHAERIIFSIAKILSVVLSSTRADDMVKDAEDGVLVVELVRTTLYLMRQVTEADNQPDAKCAFRAMAMTCAVSAAGITAAINCETASPLLAYRENLAECIIFSVTKTVIPNFNKLEFDKKYNPLYTWFVSSLNGIYGLKLCNTKDLSNFLAEQGYLRILPILSTFVLQNLRSEILLLLSRILTTLASVSLSATTWPGGIKQFQRFLFNAFNSLPIDPSIWPTLLNEGDDRADALLVLFYYYFLAEITDAAVYLPMIVGYVTSSASLKTKRRSMTMLTALWFAFCIAAICHENPYDIDSYNSATNRMFKELELVELERCYTHHPSLVVHCLRTTIVPHKLRLGVVRLWLQNGGDIGCLVRGIVDCVLMNQCLVELIRTGSPQTVDITMKAIPELLVENSEDVKGFGNIVWEVLSRMLAFRSEENAHNTKGVLRLATMFAPKDISAIAMVRSLYQLIRFVLENEADSILVSLGIRNIYHILQLSIERKDLQGVTISTQEPRLLRVLKKLAIGKEDAALSYISYHCLCLLINHQNKYSVECEESVEIELEDLLEELRVDDCLGALRFATTIFADRTGKPIIELKSILSGSNRHQVIVDLYLQVHNIHAKSGPQGRDWSYMLLIELLSYCGSVNDMRLSKILCEQSWTYRLISVTIGENRRTMNPNFINFVSKWLLCWYSISPASEGRNDRALCKDQFETILDLIGNAALSIFKEHPKKELLSELVEVLLLFQEKLAVSIGAQLLQVHQQLSKDYMYIKK